MRASDIITEPAGGMKDDGGKPKMSLLSMSRALTAVVRILEHGAAKYDRENWRKVSPDRYRDALGRHLMDYYAQRAQGVVIPLDKDSGLPVMAHIACDALFTLELETKGNDDE
jgi:hypothetical protein